MPELIPDRNTFWAKTFVDELARSGLRAVCIVPGSRSTPLTLAFAAHPSIRVHSLLDERSAAFFALGIGLATNVPGALVCTSGTAAANFYPAIIEANQSNIPLLILSADRPHELRGSGANQTIDQVKMYGDHVRWFVDVAPPEANPPSVVVKYVRTLACRAMATAQGMSPGPVHLNFPFRKPLEPTSLPGENVSPESGRTEGTPFTQISRGELTPTRDQIDTLANAVRLAKRGLIICGPRCPGNHFPEAVAHLAMKAGFPILADALSGVRFGKAVLMANEIEGSETAQLVFGGYDTFLPSLLQNGWEPPDLVIQFGGTPTSKMLNDLLADLPSKAARFSIQEYGRWQDDTHGISHLIWAKPQTICKQLTEKLQNVKLSLNHRWTSILERVETRTWENFDSARKETYFEGAILADVIDILPEGASLFVASSLPVRHLDQFGQPSPKRLRVFANRGASGIDGTISSAVGAASEIANPMVLVTGDLAFYHDMNGLLALKRNDVKATIVLINNDGGGIFHRLPISQFDPPFTELFLTPHGLDFEPAARIYGIGYGKVTNRDELRSALSAAIGSQNSRIIEIRTDSKFHEKIRRKLSQTI